MSELESMAHRLMVQQGLLPDISAAVVAETGRILGASVAYGPDVRDLSDLLWASIDNDASRDLERLSVAEPIGGDAVKIFTPSPTSMPSSSDALRSMRMHESIQRRSTRPRDLSDAAGATLHRPHLSRGGPGAPAIVIEMVVDADGTMRGSEVHRAAVRNHAKLAYNSVAAWLDVAAPAPARLRQARRGRSA